MIGTLAQAIDDMKGGVYNFTKDGECSNCGQCCSNFLPISRKEAGTIARYIKKHGIKEHINCPPTAQLTMDWTCPFRNEAERKCDIYPVRPAICRDFRCDKPAKGIMASRDMYEGRYGIADMREMFFGKEKG